MRRHDVETSLDGIRRRAQRRREARFTGLLHHLCAVERLEHGYLAVKRDAAATNRGALPAAVRISSHRLVDDPTHGTSRDGWAGGEWPLHETLEASL